MVPRGIADGVTCYTRVERNSAEFRKFLPRARCPFHPLSAIGLRISIRNWPPVDDEHRTSPRSDSARLSTGPAISGVPPSAMEAAGLFSRSCTCASEIKFSRRTGHGAPGATPGGRPLIAPRNLAEGNHFGVRRCGTCARCRRFCSCESLQFP